MHLHSMAVLQYVNRPKPFTATQWFIVNVMGACVVLAGGSYYRIIDQVNENLAETARFSKWQRDPFTFYRLIKTHRKFYPKSHLRVIHFAGTVGMLAMIPVMILLGPP